MTMTRKFNGKTYREATCAPNKRSAQIAAEEWRKDGWNARVVKKQHSYTIYVRKR
jgi:hypothetical protein